MEKLQEVYRRGNWRFNIPLREKMYEAVRVLKRANVSGIEMFGSLEFWGLDGLSEEQLDESKITGKSIKKGLR